MRARVGNTIDIELFMVQGDEFFSNFELHHLHFNSPLQNSHNSANRSKNALNLYSHIPERV